MSTRSASRRQIEANRRNWAKRRGLTVEGRERLRAAALRNRPWNFSTGPRSPAGKRRSRENALRAGKHCRTLEPFDSHRRLCHTIRRFGRSFASLSDAQRESDLERIAMLLERFFLCVGVWPTEAADAAERLVTAVLLELIGRTRDLFVRLMLLETYNAFADVDEFGGVPPLTVRLSPTERPAVTPQQLSEGG
ncbi:MAG: hypothetical protein V3T70_08595 [Phycisphaerae bacterium]